MVRLALLSASAVAVVSFLPTTSGFQLGSNGRVMWEDNCSLSGNCYRSLGTVPAQCGDTCASDLACTHWVWNNVNGGTCWLMNGARSTKTQVLATNCGYVVSRSAQGQAQVQVQTQTQTQARAQAPPQAQARFQAPPQDQAQAQAQTPDRAAIPAQALSMSGLTAAEMDEMLQRINLFRARYGLGALTIDRQLVAASASQSRDQAGRCQMTHSSSSGLSLGERIQAQGYGYVVVTENVAAGQNTVESVMTAWQNSPEHRANLLDRDVVNVGFSKAVNRGCNGYETYWTQDFGRRE